MSRADESGVQNTAKQQNATYNANAQTAFTGAQDSIGREEGDITTQEDDIGNYRDQLSKFAAANPYGKGGEYQTSINQSTAGTADAGSEAAASEAQAAALRGGVNSGAGVAAGVGAAQANTRALLQTQAKANADRISQGAGYGEKVLQASAVPATLQGAVAGEQGGITGEQANLTGSEAGNANGALGIDQKAADQPNFWDTLGSSFASSLGKTAGGGNGSAQMAGKALMG